MQTKKMIEELSNACGAPGFEENVLDVIQSHCGNLSFQRDSMMNAYLNLDNKENKKMTVMLDGHLDEVGFMVQSIDEKGLLHFIKLGGWVDTNIPAHLVRVRNDDGDYVQGVVTSKPPHFMTEEERSKKVSFLDMQIDIGASSRDEVINDFKISVAAPVVPDVTFTFNKNNQIMMGKAFDNRLGCAAVIETLKRLQNEETAIHAVGALAAQEEVGTRGAQVTANRVKPDFAIVFEGSPADDVYRDQYSAQGVLHGGPQIRHRDNSYVSHQGLIRYAKKIADKNNIVCQDAVRLSGGTNAGKIHLSNEGVPTLVLGIPTRYAHTHYCYASYRDFEATVRLAVEIVKSMTEATIANL